MTIEEQIQKIPALVAFFSATDKSQLDAAFADLDKTYPVVVVGRAGEKHQIDMAVHCIALSLKKTVCAQYLCDNTQQHAAYIETVRMLLKVHAFDVVRPSFRAMTKPQKEDFVVGRGDGFFDSSQGFLHYAVQKPSVILVQWVLRQAKNYQFEHRLTKFNNLALRQAAKLENHDILALLLVVDAIAKNIDNSGIYGDHQDSAIEVAVAHGSLQNVSLLQTVMTEKWRNFSGETVDRLISSAIKIALVGNYGDIIASMSEASKPVKHQVKNRWLYSVFFLVDRILENMEKKHNKRRFSITGSAKYVQLKTLRLFLQSQCLGVIDWLAERQHMWLVFSVLQDICLTKRNPFGFFRPHTGNELAALVGPNITVKRMPISRKNRAELKAVLRNEESTSAQILAGLEVVGALPCLNSATEKDHFINVLRIK